MSRNLKIFVMTVISSLFVLTTGCISQIPTNNRFDIASQNVTPAMLIQSTCAIPENTTDSISSGKWIHINSIGDRYLDEKNSLLTG